MEPSLPPRPAENAEGGVTEGDPEISDSRDSQFEPKNLPARVKEHHIIIIDLIRELQWLKRRMRELKRENMALRGHTDSREGIRREGLSSVKSVPTPRAHLLFIHGFSDHSANYTSNLFPALAAHSISITAFDQRGWGRSVAHPRDRGLTGPTTTVLADITSVLSTLLPSPVPVFLMGHSMGGAEALVYAAQGPSETVSQIRGVLASAPLIALHPHTAPWRATVVAGRVAAKMLPRFKMVNRLDSKWLSHDEGKNREWEADGLCHDTGTLEGLAGMLDRGEGLDRGLDTFLVREGRGEGGALAVWIAHGTEDRINWVEGSRRYFERLGEVRDKEFRAYEGGYHNLHIDLPPGADGVQFREDVAKWILDRSGPLSDASKAKL
ncbi:hypothetical protein M8818_006160 [Zalaria obscura]|uniref:Uncharacterized protein n=1 Tax=Zalaria obscura TaxID=2024903 RepID=A0ACC3S753_9PEZI